MSEKQKIEKQKTEDRSQETKNKLVELLAREPELAAKLAEALATERFLITISCQKKDKPDDQHDLRHYWMQRGYNKNDVVPSLKHLAADFIAKENPTADLPDRNGWH